MVRTPVRPDPMEGSPVISLDDTFLNDVGLADLPTTRREALLQHLYDELELRVGTLLSDGLSDVQLEEFESIIDRDLAAVTTWLDAAVPDFLDDPLYDTMVERHSAATADVVICEYAATKWLEVNRPDYRHLVAAEFERMTGEVRERAADLLAAAT